VFPCDVQAQQQSKQEQTCSEEHKQPQISCQQQQQDLHQQQHQDEQEQQLEQPEHRALPSAVDDTMQQHQHQVLQQVQPHQSLEQQLASFRRLRQTVNARDLYRRTPLIVAAKQGHLACTQLLVEGAANLFAVDREGNT
jgi:ankyrin repeat protein